MCFLHTTGVESDSSPLILLVEDDAYLAGLLIEVLSVEIFNGKQAFYQVKRVASEATATQILRSVSPLLCVFEHHPPIIDGLKLYDQMCTVDGVQRIPTLLISNDLPHIELLRRQLNGLQKPFDLEAFIQLIRAMLTGKPQPKDQPDPKTLKSSCGCSSGQHFSAFSAGQVAAAFSRTATRNMPFLSSLENGAYAIG